MLRIFFFLAGGGTTNDFRPKIIFGPPQIRGKKKKNLNLVPFLKTAYIFSGAPSGADFF